MANITLLFTNTLSLYLIIINFFLAFFIIFKNPKKRVNQSFSLLCLALSLWTLSLFAPQYFQNNVVLWRKISFFTQIIIVLDIWYLSFIYPRQEKELTSAGLIVGTAYLIIFTILLFFSSFWVSSSGSLGSGYILFITYSWIPIAWAILNFYQKFKKTIGLEKTQLTYVFWAFIIWALSANFLSPLFFIRNNINAYSAFAGLSALIFSIAIFYAIARYRLLDIRFLISKAIVYGLTVVLIIVAYTILLFIFGLYFYEAKLSSTNLFITLSLTLLIALTIVPIKKVLDKLTNRSILKDKILQNNALSEFSLLFATTNNLSTLVNGFYQKLIDIFKLEKAVFVYTNHKFQVFSTTPKSNLNKSECNEILNLKKNIIIFDDLKESQIKNILRRHKIYYTHIFSGSDFSALIFLGYKLNGDIYFEDERNYFKILFPQFLIALERIAIYEKLENFNQQLSKKVKIATLDLRQTNENLKKALKLKDELISIVSHELTLPMASISGTLSTILEGLTGKIPQTTYDFLQSVYNENARLIRLTKNLLNISKIKSKRISFNIEKFNPKNLIIEAVQLTKPQAEEKKLKISTKIADSKLKVRADRDKLKEIIINLIDNSIRYTNKGSITIGYEPDKNMVKFYVSDTGLGIPKQMQNNLFKNLDLLNEDSILTKKGRGLGLYICHHLINGMKGRISVDSKLKQGTTFYFWLPKEKI